MGLAIAVACREAGIARITVVERATLGAGATGRSAGLIAPGVHHGTDPPRLSELCRAGLAAWHDLEARLPGGLGLVSQTWLELEPIPPQRAANPPPDADWLSAADVHLLIPELATPRSGLLHRQQARVNPLRALARMAAHVDCAATGVEASDVVIRGERAAAVSTSIGQLHPGIVVLAAGSRWPSG